MPRKSFSGSAAPTTLAGSITSGNFSLSVASATGYPVSADPFVIVIGRGTSSEEKVLISAISGTTFTVFPSTGRGYDGTTAQSHQVGDTVEHCLDSITVAEANAHVNDDTADDHSQYLNTTRHDTTARHTFGSAFASPSAPPSIATAGSAGASGGPARSDHTHNIGAGAINSSGMFAAGVVDAAAIATSAVTTAEILDGTIVNADISASAAIANSKVAGLGGAALLNVGTTAGTVAAGDDSRFGATVTPGDNTVSTIKIQDNAVTTAKIADAQVTSAKLAAGALTSAALPSGTVIGVAFIRIVPTLTFDKSGVTYSDWLATGGGPLMVTYTKKLGGSVSSMLVEFGGTAYPNNAAGHLYTFGISVDTAAAVEAARLFSNDIGSSTTYPTPVTNPDHSYIGGGRLISGTAAGIRTFTLQAKCDSVSTSSIRCDGNDTWWLKATEIVV